MYGTFTPLLTQLLTPDLVAKMASASGISDVASAQKTISGAVPAVLSQLADLVSKPDGARRVSDAVAKQPQNLLESLASMAGGSGQLVNIGKSTLTTLFDTSTLGSLTSALGRYGGVGEGATGSLLAMLTPVILGVLGSQAGPGASGLAQLLTSQKDKYVGAIPPGLSDLLKSSDANPERPVTPLAAPGRISDTYRTPKENAGNAAYAMGSSRPSAASPTWIYWALPAVALAGLAWYVLGGESTPQPIAKGPSHTIEPMV